MNKDTVYRQAAIDAVNSHFGFSIEEEYGSAVQEVLNGLPSAQPEIIRCKDCKWCEDTDGLMCKNTASWVVATDYDFGCILAERRQDESEKL